MDEWEVGAKYRWLKGGKHYHKEVTFIGFAYGYAMLKNPDGRASLCVRWHNRFVRVETPQIAKAA